MQPALPFVGTGMVVPLGDVTTDWSGGVAGKSVRVRVSLGALGLDMDAMPREPRSMQFLAKHQGSWTGTNRFRLMPTDEPRVAPATAEVSVAAGGNLTLIAYTWSHPEAGVQDGLLIVGLDDESGRVVALWGDSRHQAPAAKGLAGVTDTGVVTVGYSYAADWEWTITVDATDLEILRIHGQRDSSIGATEEHPAGAYWAMDTELRCGR